jgi:hypothetical protein
MAQVILNQPLSLIILISNHNMSPPKGKMARKRAGNNRPTPAGKKKAPPAKAARTTASTGSSATTPKASSAPRNDPNPTSDTEVEEESVVDPTTTTQPTASVATNAPVSTVHVQGTDDNSAVGTGNDELTAAASAATATTAAFTALSSPTSNLTQMKFTIRNFVTQHFFPQVKFITKKEKLAYYRPGANPGSYCNIITRGCHLPQGQDHAQWWETIAKRVVKRKIAQLRSDKITALKKAYYGKWWSYVRYGLFGLLGY